MEARMPEVRFYEPREVPDASFAFAVIAARYGITSFERNNNFISRIIIQFHIVFKANSEL